MTNASMTMPAIPLWLGSLFRFQVGWFAAVWGAGAGWPLLGPAVIFPFLALHLRAASRPRQEALLLVLAMAIGTLFDTVMWQMGLLEYYEHSGPLAPVWIIALWGNFASTLNLVLRPWRHRSVQLALLGLVGGPVAYWGGVELGAITWLQRGPVLVYLGFGWALLTPLLAQLALRLDGYRHVDES